MCRRRPQPRADCWRRWAVAEGSGREGVPPLRRWTATPLASATSYQPTPLCPASRRPVGSQEANLLPTLLPAAPGPLLAPLRARRAPPASRDRRHPRGSGASRHGVQVSAGWLPSRSAHPPSLTGGSSAPRPRECNLRFQNVEDFANHKERVRAVGPPTGVGPDPGLVPAPRARLAPQFCVGTEYHDPKRLAESVARDGVESDKQMSLDEVKRCGHARRRCRRPDRATP